MTNGKFEYVIDTENFNGFAKFILINGESPYTHKTAMDYTLEGYAVMSEGDFTKFIEDYEKSLCNNWKEITYLAQRPQTASRYICLL